MFPEITHDDVFRLETERLWLRWPRLADAAAFVALLNDPEVTRYTTLPSPYRSTDAENFIRFAREANAAGESLYLALAPKRDPNSPIGVISAEGAQSRGASRLGFWLGRPHWGQGLMSEAASAFVDLVFKITSLERIVSSATPDNAASLRLQDRLGFVRTGRAAIDAPHAGGSLEVIATELKRGAAHTSFGARRPRLNST
jgi:RimJ/RimL family protein N-acetyltransferase